MRQFLRPLVAFFLISNFAGAYLAQSAGRALDSDAAVVALPEGQAWSAPVPSPDGRSLALTSPSFRGISLLDTQTGEVLRLTDQEGAGFRPAWSADSRSLAYRAALGGARRKKLIAVGHTDGVVESASPLLDSVSVPLWRGLQLIYFLAGRERPEMRNLGPAEAEDAPSTALPAASPGGRLFLVAPDGKTTDATIPGKVLFLPVLSGDGKQFVAECLDGHLYLGSTEGGPLTDLGPGSWPSFARDDTSLLFERTTDDGHAVTSSQLFLMDLRTRQAVPITAEKEIVARHPALAGDGHTLYFDAAGAIYRGWLP